MNDLKGAIFAAFDFALMNIGVTKRNDLEEMVEEIRQGYETNEQNWENIRELRDANFKEAYEARDYWKAKCEYYKEEYEKLKEDTND